VEKKYDVDVKVPLIRKEIHMDKYQGRKYRQFFFFIATHSSLEEQCTVDAELSVTVEQNSLAVRVLSS